MLWSQAEKLSGESSCNRLGQEQRTGLSRAWGSKEKRQRPHPVLWASPAAPQ